ncbi:MAG TPA: Coenzyme F420 hydrogenase/dehydrogenase, beta subunit C-terminal domain [Enorma phocaeensis]|uniref:Coenzyme F420 hydrogenase/dehydrogenase, beta subunit C-terminal domain n=1 Tax=Enorma phocaeensis TaxID=1871019 RepID=A0A921IW72_9ACTN|nr:Coenzyme F420 hydrogenase/dehydrogenase, beta subunit C-terminal domain [Enorma phocaeensis]
MLCDKEKCTGCGACMNACPKRCISMAQDDNGFLAPVIKMDLCVHCGLCDRACPELNPQIPARAIPVAFAACSADESVLERSASGGMFSALSKQVIENGGYVFGAVWGEEFSCKQVCAKSMDELDSMRGSKYVQSSTEDTFRQVKQALDDGREVLYSGVPCQLAGLYGYLGGDREGLITVDLVCHGGGSVGVFQQYLAYKQSDRKLAGIDQTSKVNGWTPLIQKTIRFEYHDGTVEYIDSSQDPYLGPFLDGLFYRESCYSCPYACVPRVADITLADYFGLGAVHPCTLDVSKGVSQILINSKKGVDLINRCRGSITLEQRKLEECMMFNGCLLAPSHRSALRDQFLESYRNGESFNSLRRYLDERDSYSKNKKVRRMIKGLLGHRLTALGMYCVYVLQGKRKIVKKRMADLESTLPAIDAASIDR